MLTCVICYVNLCTFHRQCISYDFCHEGREPEGETDLGIFNEGDTKEGGHLSLLGATSLRGNYGYMERTLTYARWGFTLNPFVSGVIFLNFNKMAVTVIFH